MAPMLLCPLPRGQVTRQIFPEAILDTQSLKVSVTHTHTDTHTHTHWALLLTSGSGWQ